MNQRTMTMRLRATTSGTDEKRRQLQEKLESRGAEGFRLQFRSQNFERFTTRYKIDLKGGKSQTTITTIAEPADQQSGSSWFEI
jgi:hypothetical protein